MKVLTLDLGMTTGYAVVVEDSIIAHGLIDIEDFPKDLYCVLDMYDPDLVVVEDPIIIRGDLGNSLRWVLAKCQEMVPDAVYVRPSEWKPHPISKAPLVGVPTTHERDACHIGLWYTSVHLKSQA